MGAGPSRKQESARSPPALALQLLKAQFRKSPAGEGARISYVPKGAPPESAAPTHEALGAYGHMQSAI